MSKDQTPAPLGAEYVCHKRVHAIRILDFDYTGDPEIVRLRFGAGTPPLEIKLSEVRGLEAGGYLVQYEGGYRSFSPAHAFEKGYTQVLESKPPASSSGHCEGCE